MDLTISNCVEVKLRYRAPHRTAATVEQALVSYSVRNRFQQRWNRRATDAEGRRYYELCIAGWQRWLAKLEQDSAPGDEPGARVSSGELILVARHQDVMDGDSGYSPITDITGGTGRAGYADEKPRQHQASEARTKAARH
jgi:hypothetical protein